MCPLCVQWLLNVSQLYVRSSVHSLHSIKFSAAEPMKPAFVKPIKDLKVVIGQPMLLEAQIVGVSVASFLNEGMVLLLTQILSITFTVPISRNQMVQRWRTASTIESSQFYQPTGRCDWLRVKSNSKVKSKTDFL